ncbi:MAG: hypothetical protein AB1896_07260 [Thermodesulfobacteriota bacterium]
MPDKLFRLKPATEAFRVMDGEYAGRRFEHGRVYHADQVPPEYADRFEAVVLAKDKSNKTERTNKPKQTAALSSETGGEA